MKDIYEYDKFRSFCAGLGVILIAIAMLSVPFLCACSFVLEWHESTRWGLVVLSIFDFLAEFVFVANSIG